MNKTTLEYCQDEAAELPPKPLVDPLDVYIGGAPHVRLRSRIAGTAATLQEADLTRSLRARA